MCDSSAVKVIVWKAPPGENVPVIIDCRLLKQNCLASFHPNLRTKVRTVDSPLRLNSSNQYGTFSECIALKIYT